jgi:hypothetical protein
MQLTGHLTRSVFERYNIVSPGDLKDAARKLNAAVQGQKWDNSSSLIGVLAELLSKSLTSP